MFNEAGTLNFFNDDRSLGAITFSRGDIYESSERLLFLKKEIIDSLIKETNSDFYLITWGEREFRPENSEEVRHPDFYKIREEYLNISKRILKYDIKTSKFIEI